MHSEENLNFNFTPNSAQPPVPSTASMTGATQNAPPVVVVVQQGGNGERAADKEHFSKMFPVKIISAMSAAQIFIFFVALICEIVLIVNETYGPQDGVAGIWGGIFFGAAGAMGLLATWRPSQCSIVSFMVMSIIATCFCIPVIVWSGVGMGESKRRYRYYGNDEDNDETTSKINLVFYGIIFFCGFVESLLSIACAAMCCRATCCRKQTAGTVIYNPNIEAQPSGMISIPLNTVQANAPQEDQPPKYEQVPNEGEKYQRFG